MAIQMNQDEMIAVIRQQHKALDGLMARLIVLTRQQGLDSYFPTKDAETWAAVQAGYAIIKKWEAGPR